MTTASLSDQFFAASETFHKTRIAYEAKRQDLGELEQELLRYTKDYQALLEQAEYVGDGTCRAWGNTSSAVKKARAKLLDLRLQPHRQETCLLP